MKLSLALTGLSLVAGEEVLAFQISSKRRASHLKLFASVDKQLLQQSSAANLPDYGKTSVEVDKIRLTRANPWRRKDLFGNSLVDQTIDELTNDAEFQDTEQRLKSIGAAQMSKEERLKRRRALDDLGIPSFEDFLQNQLQSAEKVTLTRKKAPTVLQVNVGLYCNQACAHCHVESSPLRTEEQMINEVMVQCLELLKVSPSIQTLDITGGAPELNQSFRYLVTMARELRPDLEIIDRCNLTVLQEPGQEDLVEFLKENRVRIVASLPCYSAENVNKQRGNGVFDRSIAALLALNDAGYGHPDSGSPPLDLVYNPLGAFLPPEQGKLEVKYKEVLDENFGILFDSLFTITNMPIKRFADFLYRRGELKDYMDLLQRNFNPDTMKSLMCYNTVSIGYDGKIYDCDFNQQLGYAVGVDDIHQGGLTVFDVGSFESLQGQAIRTDNHCFGCTAGMGSS
jgi:radical SAM/Cys-rich protein